MVKLQQTVKRSLVTWGVQYCSSVTIPCLCIVTAKTSQRRREHMKRQTGLPLSSATPACHWLQLDPITSGATSAFGIRRPLVVTAWPAWCRTGWTSVGGGTKQYERFRDTIFLNYWAIVFVQDVVFFLFHFDCYFNVFVIFFFLCVCVSKMVCLCLFFSL